MDKYYDDKCLQCEQGCHYYSHGEMPDGTPYECCKCYGYILHKMVVFSCDGYKTEDKWMAEQELKKIRTKINKKRK